jgi:hypothetical protein
MAQDGKVSTFAVRLVRRRTANSYVFVVRFAVARTANRQKKRKNAGMARHLRATTTPEPPPDLAPATASRPSRAT